MSEGRNEKGRFIKGEYHGGPGRPRTAAAPSRQQILTETVTAEKFKAAIQQVWLDAVGKRIDKDGRLVDDPRSTPLARSSAFARLAAYMLGKPLQPVLVDNAEGSVLEVFRSMTDEQLDQIIAEAQRVVQNDADDTTPELPAK